MGLAYRQVGWVRVEQKRALLGLHEVCWLHCFFFGSAILSEC